MASSKPVIFSSSNSRGWLGEQIHDHVCTLHPTQTVITSNYNACSRTLTSLVKPLQANGDSELRSKYSTSQPPAALSFTSDKTWSRCDSLEVLAVFWLQASPEVSVSTRQQLDDNSWTRRFASLLSYKAFVGFLNRHILLSVPWKPIYKFCHWLNTKQYLFSYSNFFLLLFQKSNLTCFLNLQPFNSLDLLHLSVCLIGKRSLCIL